MSYDTNLRAAVAALIKAKGRHHSMLTYQALVKAFNAGETTMAGKMTSQYTLTHDEQAKMMEQYARNMMPIKTDPIYDARCALQDKTDWSAS